MMLTQDACAAAGRFVEQTARGLDRALFAYYFEGGSPGAVLEELRHYQNADGGFGNWLESDFALAASSPIATTTGLQYLTAVEAPATHPVVRGAVSYLLARYDREEQRWHAVPPEVNDAPHAPWWHYDESAGGCLIDRSPGNPGAEIAGHLHRYRKLVPADFLEQVTEVYVDRLRRMPDRNDSMHEVYCYAKLAEYLPGARREECLWKLEGLVRGCVELDPGRWSEYGASPLFFVHSPDSPFARLFPQALEANLDYLIGSQAPDGSWQPNWSWGEQYVETWPEAFRRWSGHLTVRNLKVLSNFGKIARRS